MIPRYEEHVRPEGERSREMAEEAGSRRWKGAHLMEKVRCTCMLRLVPMFSLLLSESSVFWSCWFFFFFQLSSFFSHFTVLLEDLPCTRWYPGCSS